MNNQHKGYKVLKILFLNFFLINFPVACLLKKHYNHCTFLLMKHKFHKAFTLFSIIIYQSTQK